MRSISYMRGRPSVDDDALIDGRVSAEAQAEIGWPLLGFFAARSLHGFSAGGSASTPTHGCEPADHSHSLVRRLAMNESAILLGLLEARSMSKVGKGGTCFPEKDGGGFRQRHEKAPNSMDVSDDVWKTFLISQLRRPHA